jgi:NhaP-type Na+/H+ or K+/H+ antiporter
MYAINQGLPEEMALELIHLTLVVVTLSIVLHGVSAKPLILRFWRRRDAEQAARQSGSPLSGDRSGRAAA